MQLQLLLKDYITLIVVLIPQPLLCTPAETNIASSHISHISSSSVIYRKMLSLTAQDNYHTLTMKRNGCWKKSPNNVQDRIKGNGGKGESRMIDKMKGTWGKVLKHGYYTDLLIKKKWSTYSKLDLRFLVRLWYNKFVGKLKQQMHRCCPLIHFFVDACGICGWLGCCFSSVVISTNTVDIFEHKLS